MTVTRAAERPVSLAQRLNWLRAGVLGANDGIVSVAAVVVGVAAASASQAALLTAGLAALVGGAISMALGEYVSVSSQRDSERAHIARGELVLAEEDVVSPWHAASASAAAFTVGGVLPLLSVLLVPQPWKVFLTFVVVLAALAVAGWTAARIGGSPWLRSTARVVVGGALALGVTFGLGSLLGVTGVV
ncbi:VIT1/CCC1 transporter family protein [Xylanimonas sp. McL0601]|uniref:VIT1/CCC1 transporter family protein n=1 Tax=Xylanimonas sp. McL0601 TaxID=3414739 RepID=UPI003CF82BB2